MIQMSVDFFISVFYQVEFTIGFCVTRADFEAIVVVC